MSIFLKEMLLDLKIRYVFILAVKDEFIAQSISYLKVCNIKLVLIKNLGQSKWSEKDL